MSDIINTERGTYDLSDRKEFCAYLCQNYGFKSNILGYITRHLLTEFEALEDRAAIAENAMLEIESKNVELHRRITDEQSGIQDQSLEKHLRWELNKLQHQLTQATEALEFYASKNNWKETDDYEVYFAPNDYEQESRNRYGGKLARETLSKLKSGKGEL